MQGLVRCQWGDVAWKHAQSAQIDGFAELPSQPFQQQQRRAISDHVYAQLLKAQHEADEF